MKKRRKTMLRLLVLLMVVVVGYFVIEKIQTAQLEKKEKEAESEPVYVISVSDVAAFRYSDGSTTLSFVQESEAWLYEGDKSLDLEESDVEAITSELAVVEALRVLESPDALADYGLETPVYTVEVQDASGNTATIYIGNETDSGYYATTGEKEVVYIVSSSVVSAMEWDVNELVYVEETEEKTTE